MLDGFLVLSFLGLLLLLVLAPVMPRFRLGTRCMLRCLRCVPRFRVCPCWSCLVARALVFDARFLCVYVSSLCSLSCSSFVCLSPFVCLFLSASLCCCLCVRSFLAGRLLLALWGTRLLEVMTVLRYSSCAYMLQLRLRLLEPLLDAR